jgi:hypothetical protein
MMVPITGRHTAYLRLMQCDPIARGNTPLIIPILTIAAHLGTFVMLALERFFRLALMVTRRLGVGVMVLDFKVRPSNKPDLTRLASDDAAIKVVTDKFFPRF